MSALPSDLESLFVEHGFDAAFWERNEPRNAEPFDVSKLAQSVDTDDASLPHDFSFYAPYETSSDVAESDSAWDPECPVDSYGETADKGLRNTIALCGLLVMDQLISMANGQPTVADEPQRRIVEALEASSSAALVLALMSVADNLALNNWRVDSIPSIYEYALEIAPRPNLHNEIGVMLLERAGVRQGLKDELDVVICARDFGGAEILSWEGRDPPLISDYSSGLTRIAGDAFARAYKFYEGGWNPDERLSLANYYQIGCAMDGLRVAGQELDFPDSLAWHLYVNNFGIAECGPREAPGKVPELGLEFARRFSYDVGLREGAARGRDAGDALQEASHALKPQLTLVDEIGQAIAKATRSASNEQWAESESRAAELAGSVWPDLPSGVRHDLIQAEFLQTFNYPAPFNYATVTHSYGLAVERLLCSVFAVEFKRVLSELEIPEHIFLKEHNLRFENGMSRGMIGEFLYLIRKCVDDPLMDAFMKRTPLQHVGYLRGIYGKLDDFNKKYRRVADHAGRPVHGRDLLKIRADLYGQRGAPQDSLLSLLVKLRIETEATS